MKKEAALITLLITFLIILMAIVFAQEDQNTEMADEQVKCIFPGSDSEQKCYAEGFACGGAENCITQVSGAQGKALTWKSTCGGYAATIIDGQNEEISFKCGQQQPQPAPVQTSPSVQPPAQKCIDPGCVKREKISGVKGEKITEQITCIFVNSGKEQECYIAGSFTGEDEGKKFCRGKEDCIINYDGNKGEQVTWKSTCGGYQYTAQDGNGEEIRFECKTGETNPTEIKNRGFRFAYWQCYDGSESRSEDTTSCKTSETWQKYAAEFCAGKCYDDNSKCGVNSFSISNECYTEAGAPVPVSATPVPAATTVIPAVPAEAPAAPNAIAVPAQNTDKKITEPIPAAEQILICKDSCPSGGKCYPFGYRKAGMFCLDEGKFAEQLKEDGSCENNFECASNVCVDGKCMSSGLIQKIISLFRGMFGIG